MSWIIPVLGAVFAIFCIILIHEMGHLLMAKLLGVRVLRFSIGFGKPLFKWHTKSGTEYALAAFPLGGYVRMLTQDMVAKYPGSEAYAYERQAVWKRILIVLAGPFSNFCLAAVAFWIIFIIGFAYVKPMVGQVLPNTPASQAGLQRSDAITSIDGAMVYGWPDAIMTFIESVGNAQPITVEVRRGQNVQQYPLSLRDVKIVGREFDLLQAIGIVPFQSTGPALIAQVGPNSPAEHAGLQAGDLIQQIAGHPVGNWIQAQHLIQTHPNQTIAIRALHQGQIIDTTADLGSLPRQDNKMVGFLGISFKLSPLSKNMIGLRKENVIHAWAPAINQVYTLILFNVKVVVKMVHGLIPLSGLSGPVGILQSAGQATQGGFQSYLSFIALISIALGFVNLLPIPVLDGGHLLFYIIELVIRRPVPFQVQKVFWAFGFTFLFIMVIFATYNDLMQILSKI